jgi:hypothetical protein
MNEFSQEFTDDQIGEAQKKLDCLCKKYGVETFILGEDKPKWRKLPYSAK